jgi:hypothetical protein
LSYSYRPITRALHTAIEFAISMPAKACPDRLSFIRESGDTRDLRCMIMAEYDATYSDDEGALPHIKYAFLTVVEALP